MLPAGELHPQPIQTRCCFIPRSRSSRVRFGTLCVYQGPNPVSAAGHLVGTAAKRTRQDQAAIVRFMVVGFALNFVISTLAYFLLSKPDRHARRSTGDGRRSPRVGLGRDILPQLAVF